MRLACVKHAASVRSEPGSNSQVLPASALPLPPSESPSPTQQITNYSVRPPFPPTHHLSPHNDQQFSSQKLRSQLLLLLPSQIYSLKEQRDDRLCSPFGAQSAACPDTAEPGRAMKLAGRPRRFKCPTSSSEALSRRRLRGCQTLPRHFLSMPRENLARRLSHPRGYCCRGSPCPRRQAAA